MSEISTSYVRWVDYSQCERQAMLDVLSLFKQQGVLDELGIGTIRDTIADFLFPGTSTIQTRIRYFLIVAWIYDRVEKRSWKGRTAAQYAQYVEGRVTESLKRSAPGAGVIGAEVGAAVQRPASDVYWQGLGRWGIRRFRGSRDAYHRWLQTRRARASTIPSELAEAEDVESPVEISTRWRVVPEPPPGFPDLATLDLIAVEAEYLRERIIASAPNSLLAHLMTSGSLIGDAALPWEMPGLASIPETPTRHLQVAREFSEGMYGSALLYNLLLAREAKGDLVETYEARVAAWGDRLAARAFTWQLDPLLSALLGVGRVPQPLTWQFVKDWHAIVTGYLNGGHSPSLVASDAEAERLIREREWMVKGPRARLGNKDRAPSWSGASGGEQLNFRWPVVVRHVRDVRSALQLPC